MASILQRLVMELTLNPAVGLCCSSLFLVVNVLNKAFRWVEEADVGCGRGVLT